MNPKSNGISMQSLTLNGRPSQALRNRLGGFLTGRAYLPHALHWIYLAICIPTVLFLIFFRQPLSSPDELSHISRAYQISHGVLLTEEAIPGLHPKGMVDEALFQLGGQVKKRRFESLSTALPVFQSFGWTGKEGLKRFNSSVYFPAAFVPQAVGIGIAQKLKLPLVQSLQLASLLNAATCLLMVALAIHVAAEAKFLVAFIGILPMSVHQFASPSPDGILIAGSLLLCALTITALSKAKASLPTLIAIVALGAHIAATKLPYLTLPLAALAALWRVEAHPRKHLIFICAIIITAGIPLLWMEISNASAVNHNPRFETDPGAQIAFLLSNPLHVLSLAFSTLLTYGKAYLVQIIGVLGWLDARLHPAALNFLGLGLIAILAMEGTSARSDVRSIFLAGIAASIGLIFLSLYLTWNPLFSLDPIAGVQGRYFLPVLPFLVFLMPKLKRFESDNLKLSIFVICGLVSSLATMAAIIKRYYT